MDHGKEHMSSLKNHKGLIEMPVAMNHQNFSMGWFFFRVQVTACLFVQKYYNIF
jgi:hypothetical protein